MKNTLVVYFSHSGNTEKLAQMINEIIGGEILEIKCKEPYPQPYSKVTEQAKKEIKAGILPIIEDINININLSKYDTVLIGTPNWWGTAAPPVSTFLNENDLSGKTIGVFCTHGGGGGMANIESDIKKLCPNSNFVSGLAVAGSSANDNKIKKWIDLIS